MMDQLISFSPIGIIFSPFKVAIGMPIQSAGAREVAGRIEIKPEFEEGLKDLDGFSHIFLLYHFHRASGYSLAVKPFLDDQLRGLFATRAPKRPNPIGLSVVRLIRVEGCTLHIEGVDILDGTPLLDIKPFVPRFDIPPVEKSGWLESKVSQVDQMEADERFGPEGR